VDVRTEPVRRCLLWNTLDEIMEQTAAAVDALRLDPYVDITISLLIIERSLLECRSVMLAYPKD